LLAAVLTLSLVACSDDDNGTPEPDGASPDGAIFDTGSGDTGAADAGDDTGGTTNLCGAAPDYDTAAKIEAYLEGKTLVMAGENIPTHPNGYNEDINFGTATQCYSKVTMDVNAGIYNVTSELGTLNNAPNEGDEGECDHSAKSGEVSFSSTVAKVENVASDGSCYDFTVTYTGFAQEGRGCITPDGQEVILELFFKDQATGHRCADGAVGSGGITVQGAAFTGDAIQIYEVN
jgi:hypothetical protein